MNKKILIFVVAFLLLSFNKVNAYSIDEYVNQETNYKVIIEDDAELLTEQEIHSLMDDMKTLTEYGNIAFKTINENSYTTKNYASNYYHEIFGTTSGTLFLIDMDNRYIYIFSDGSNYKTITNSKAEIITDNVYRYASNSDYYKCASNAFSQIETLLKGGKIAEPMRHISNLFISITIAFFINFIIVLLNTKTKKLSNKDIISHCKISFNVDNVSVVKVGTHKVYCPSSDGGSYGGGGSSSRGGGGGGSRSSGGGGGHRF